MASNKLNKICEVDKDVCKRQVRALCFHCSKNLCRIHLTEHAQMIEENTRTELNSLADKFNDLSSKFNGLGISSDISQQPFSELEQWRLDAHEKIEQLAEKKRQEINEKIDEYKILFAVRNGEQLEQVNASKKMITELIQDTDASSQQIADLQLSIDTTEDYLNSLNTHKISALIHPPIWLVNIYTQAFHSQSTSTPVNKLRGFKIIYIRLDGIIRHYYVKASKDGTMNDLIQSFVLQYPLLEALAVLESNSILMTQHHPKSDLILPVEVNGHCIRKHYSNDDQLTLISRGELVAFYETPYSLKDPDSSRILMPCYFQRSSNKSTFGWPIYLSVLRTGCKGQDVRDALHDSLGKLFSLDINTDQQLYDAYLKTTVKYRMTETKLNDVLQKEIDFAKENATLCVNIANQIVEKYEENALR